MRGVRAMRKRYFLWVNYFVDLLKWPDDRFASGHQHLAKISRWEERRVALPNLKVEVAGSYVKFCRLPVYSPKILSSCSIRIACYGVESIEEPSKVSKKEQLMKRIELLEYMDQRGMSISRDNIYHFLEECSKSHDLDIVRRVHALMDSSGLFSVTVLSDQLIRLFVGCGSLQEAVEVFQKVSSPSVYTCNAVMAAHAKLGNAYEVFQLYHRMKLEGIKEDTVTFLNLLKACSKLSDSLGGRHIHHQVLIGSQESSLFIGNSLVDMYAKCGTLEDARSVFDKLIHRTEVSWGAILTGYTACGYALPALELFESMKKEGVKPSKVTYLCALKASSSIGAVSKGKLVHSEVIINRLELDALVGSTLVDMYAKCGSLEDAQKVFDTLLSPDIVTWGAIIVGYAQHGHGEHVLKLFEKMQQAGVRPGIVAFSAALKACAGMGGLQQGQLLHGSTVQCGYDTDSVLGNSTVDLYAKCEKLSDARKVFDKLAHRDVVTWGTMISGYAQHGRGYAALDLFERMQGENIKPGKTTFLSAIKACSGLSTLIQGRWLHDEVIKSGFDSDSAVVNSLVDMYAKNGSLEEAQKLFDEISVKDMVSWGALITGFVVQGHGMSALDLFVKMQGERLPPNEVIYSSSLKACSIITSVEIGMLLHAHILQSDFSSNMVVESSLLDMYIKCGKLKDARSMFGCLSSRDVIAWGTLMMGFANEGDGLAVIELFVAMLKEGLGPDKVTLLCSLKACGMLGALEWGIGIHAAIVEINLESHMVLGTNLLEMYCKCGSICDGHRVFDGLSSRDAASWGALIAGYASKGDFLRIQECLEDMQKHGSKPGDVVFTSILGACSQAGLLEEGCLYFQSMVEDYGLIPSNEHCSCMVDLFARAGKLDDATDLTATMNLPDTLVWRSLLSSCRTYSNLNLASYYVEEAFVSSG